MRYLIQHWQVLELFCAIQLRLLFDSSCNDDDHQFLNIQPLPHVMLTEVQNDRQLKRADCCCLVMITSL